MLWILFLVVMAEQRRHDFVRSIRLSLFDLLRRIQHASSADEEEYGEFKKPSKGNVNVAKQKD